MSKEKKIVARWYFGGLSAAGACCFTHPLDLLKVQLQTQKGKNASLIQFTRRILKQQGVLGLYNGISASVLRQLTYSTTRFGIYETLKQFFISKDGKLPFYESVLMAGIGGFSGGLVGNPADLVNVRMQNDFKLPPEQRRNYKHAFHGIYQVIKNEGVARLWTGVSMNSCRSCLANVGQLSFYDLTKRILLKTVYFEDNVVTHIVSSLIAAIIATTLTQPVDVLKTRAMNSKVGEQSGILFLLISTAKEGPLAFFKGYVPMLIRSVPHTILTFVFLEQLRLNFGIVTDPSKQPVAVKK